MGAEFRCLSAMPSPSLGRLTGTAYLRLLRWHIEGHLPHVTRAVLIAAPHTSNWDLPFMLAVAGVLGLRLSWLGKRELFRWPFGPIMRRLGGVAVDRRASQNMVQQAVDRFAAADRLLLVVPPSGTRSRAAHWKSGFYHIARGARVPIICTFLDYRRRLGGIGPTVVPSGDVRADMAVIRRFYADVVGRYPDCTTPVRLREEDDPIAGCAG